MTAPRPPVVMLGAFGLRPKGTMSARALPLAQALAARGWPVRLVLPPWDCPADAGRREWHGPVEVVQVGLAGGVPGIVAAMARAALAGRPALVHCFKPKGHGGLAADLLRLLGRRLVVDCDDWEGPGGWNDRVAGYSPAQRLVFAWQAHRLPRIGQAVTVASRTLQTHAWGLGIAPRRVHYLPNGLSRQRHAGWLAPPDPAAERAALGVGDGPVVGLYTRFDVVTPARVVALLAALRARVPAARLLVVGAGLAGEEAHLRGLARAGGLAEAIVWAGFVPFERLPAVLRLADVAVYPIDDTLINRAKAPMKLLELLALGLPVVAEAVGETPEYLDAGRWGRLVPAGDTAALADATVALLAAPAARAHLGAAARAGVWRRHDWSVLAATAEMAYTQALAAGREREARPGG